MKRIAFTLMLLVVCLPVGCSWTSRDIVLNTLDVTMAVQDFDGIKDTIEKHQSEFTEEEWQIFVQGRRDFQLIVNSIVTSDIITLDQIISGTEALQDIYVSMYGIIDRNKNKFSPAEWYSLTTFDTRLNRIVASANKLKDSPDAEKEKELANTFLGILSVALKVAPIVL